MGSDPLGHALGELRGTDHDRRQQRLAAGPLLRQIDRYGNIGGRMGADSITARLRLLVETVLRDPQPDRYSSHSLRAGFATSAEDLRVDPDRIAAQPRHTPRGTPTRSMRACRATSCGDR